MTVVNPSYSNETTDNKAGVAKSSDTAGKAKSAPGSHSPNTNTSKASIASTTTPASGAQMTKQHLLLEKVDGNTLYTKDGTKVEIPKDARITDNTRNGEVISAELTYINGELIEAMIR
jgi:hypothetical protein